MFVNAAFERLTGFLLEEILGENCRFLQADDKDQPKIKLISRTLEQGGSCLVTIRNYRKNGDMFWNELSISPVRDGDGHPTHFINVKLFLSNNKRR